MTIKDIKDMQSKNFDGVTPNEMTKAFALVNTYKKEFMAIEKEVKAALEDYYTNPKVPEEEYVSKCSEQLTFASGQFEATSMMEDTTSYEVAVDDSKLLTELSRLGVSHNIVKTKVSISAKNLADLYENNEAVRLSGLIKKIESKNLKTKITKKKGD